MFKEILKQGYLKTLKYFLRKSFFRHTEKTIFLYLSDATKSLNIPTFLGKNLIYTKILLPFLRRDMGEGIVKIKFPKIKSPLYLRPQTSDIATFEQIFCNKDYEISLSTDPKLIIDGGANVGYASVFFANKFPNAKIIAVEPDETNFHMLKRNTLLYPNIELVKSGIWHKKEYLKVRDDGFGKWMLTVEKSEPEELESFKAVTVKEMLDYSGCEEIDILKLDIEGAEKEVFTDNYAEWLSRTNLLIIELHDRIKAGCSEAFFSAIGKYSFKQSQIGENLILEKL